VKAAIDGGMEPDAVADLVHDAIVNNRFWIFTDLGMVEMLREKHASIVENRNPQIFGIVDLD
jgi:GMP synthase PP-ATPase subunit